jgi:pimeloyl-ACP methyl ester carboxylesterase
VLIHGAGGSAVGNWFANGIARALVPTNRVIGLDMRGHGLSEVGPEGGRGNMANDVIEFLDQQGITQAHIGGYSMGGGVTAALLGIAPNRFITASFGGSGIRETEEWRDKVPADKEGEAADEIKAREAYYAARAARGEEVGNAGFGRRQLTPEQREALRRRSGPTIDLTKIEFPVLAVNGEYDGPNAKTHRLERQLKNFTNVVLPGKGHLSAVMATTIPDEYVAAVRDFIVSNNPT